jgi:DNA-binding NtrC family response regulator
MYKVLIVDDEEMVCAVLSKVISSKGYEVLVAHNGETSLELAERERPDVVLVDLLLDDMPGLAVMQRIKSVLPAVECIIVTGAPTKDSAIAAVNLGAFGFVTKPWDDDALLVMIKAGINQAETTKSLLKSEERLKQLLAEKEQY